MDLLDPQPGEDIVDIGCGWGTMLACIHARIGDCSRLFGINISPTQVQYIQEVHGYRQNIICDDAITRSYKPRSFDKVIAVGMLDHVRPKELGEFYGKIAAMLRPGGIAVLQFFPLENKEVGLSGIPAQLFFPGSRLSPYADHLAAIQRSGLHMDTDLFQRDPADPTHDYRPTLAAWYKRLFDHKETLLPLIGPERWNERAIFFPISYRFFQDGDAKIHRIRLRANN